MDSALAIVAYRLRARFREPGNRALLTLCLAALLGAVLLPGSQESGAAGAGSVAAANALLVVAVLVALEAAAGGGALPLDRAEGRTEWLATLAPSPAVHRAGALLAAVVVPVLAGVAAAAVVAVVATFANRGVLTFDAVPLDVRLAGGTPQAAAASVASVVDVPGGGAGSLEIDVRPVYRDPAATVDAEVDGELTWEAVVPGPQPPIVQAVRLPHRGSFAVAHSAEDPAERLTIRSKDPRMDVVVTGARRIAGPASFAGNLLLAGLLLGLAAACVAPVGVLASRATSAPTAALLSALVLLLGVVKGPMLSLAGDVAHAQGGTLAAGILRGAAFLSPDLSSVGSLSEVAAGRTLTTAPFAALAPAVAYAALVGAWAVLVPDRRRRR